MDTNAKKLEKQAWARAKDKKVIYRVFKGLIKDTDFSSNNYAAAVFMAGSPGAGKTEIAKELLLSFNPAPIRIDADEFRSYFDGYDGSNAHLYQQAATTMVQKVLDRVYDYGRSSPPVPFILDGTFSYAKALENIKRALKHRYAVEIYFVYQRPELAWQFTKARELREGRVVPADVFAKSFVQSIRNVIDAKNTFGDRVSVSVILKNTDALESDVNAYLSYDELVHILDFGYTEDSIKAMIGQIV